MESPLGQHSKKIMFVLENMGKNMIKKYLNLVIIHDLFAHIFLYKHNLFGVSILALHTFFLCCNQLAILRTWWDFLFTAKLLKCMTTEN